MTLSSEQRGLLGQRPLGLVGDQSLESIGSPGIVGLVHLGERVEEPNPLRLSTARPSRSKRLAFGYHVGMASV